MPTVMTLLGSVLGQEARVVTAEELGTEPSQPRTVRHWRAKEITVASTPSSSVQCDGEMIGETPKRVSILPAALQVVVPPPHLTAILAANGIADSST
jgi:diacylglycerol kinase family enzyme